jgi:hypothetical protein
MYTNVKSRAGRIALGIVLFLVATLFVAMPVGLLGSSNIVWGEDNQYGRVAVPGSTVLHLPAGRVDVSAALALPGRGNETPDLPLPSDLTLRVTPAGAGGHAVVTRDYGHSENASGDGVDTQRHVFGVEVSTAGDYRVAARGSLSDVGLNPQLWFGHGPPLPGNYVPLVAAILVSIGGAVWFLLLPRLGVRRGPEGRPGPSGEAGRRTPPGQRPRHAGPRH